MDKSDLEKRLLVKVMKKDLELALISEDIKKVEIIKILNYFLSKAEELSEESRR